MKTFLYTVTGGGPAVQYVIQSTSRRGALLKWCYYYQFKDCERLSDADLESFVINGGDESEKATFVEVKFIS